MSLTAKIYLKFFGIILAVTGLFCALLIGSLYATGARVDKLPPLRNGDLVFRSGAREQAIAIFLASSSPYTHMGIIKVTEGKNPVVIEAGRVVKETALKDWILGGVGRRLTIKRVSDLTAKQENKIIHSAEHLYGRPYDQFFMPGKDAIYCSELAYDAYQDGLGITLGKMEKLGNLNVYNSFARKLIEQRWKTHPECRRKNITDSSACLKMIYDQKLVTPASIANDRQLKLVYSNYGFEK